MSPPRAFAVRGRDERADGTSTTPSATSGPSPIVARRVAGLHLDHDRVRCRCRRSRRRRRRSSRRRTPSPPRCRRRRGSRPGPGTTAPMTVRRPRRVSRVRRRRRAGTGRRCRSRPRPPTPSSSAATVRAPPAAGRPPPPGRRRGGGPSRGRLAPASARSATTVVSRSSTRSTGTGATSGAEAVRVRPGHHDRRALASGERLRQPDHDAYRLPFADHREQPGEVVRAERGHGRGEDLVRVARGYADADSTDIDRDDAATAVGSPRSRSERRSREQAGDRRPGPRAGPPASEPPPCATSSRPPAAAADRAAPAP